MRDEEQQRKERQAKLLSAIERKIAYKNIDFIIQHQNDTKDELAIYLKACMDDIGHAPAKVEVIGGDYIEYRFGSKKPLAEFTADRFLRSNIRQPSKTGKSCRICFGKLWSSTAARILKRGCSDGTAASGQIAGERPASDRQAAHACLDFHEERRVRAGASERYA